jgi:hypothetical protein
MLVNRIIQLLQKWTIWLEIPEVGSSPADYTMLSEAIIDLALPINRIVLMMVGHFAF